MAVSGKGAHFPQDIMLMGVRSRRPAQAPPPCIGPKAHAHRTKDQLCYLSRSSNFAPEHG